MYVYICLLGGEWSGEVADRSMEDLDEDSGLSLLRRLRRPNPVLQVQGQRAINTHLYRGRV